MKNIALKIVVAFSITLFVVNTAAAQDNTSFKALEFGIRYMPTFSSLDLRTSNGDVIKGSVTMQQGFGVMLGINLSAHVGIQGELNYNQVSQSYKDVTIDRDVTIRYLNIPVLLSLNTNKASRVNLNIVAGPQFGYNVGSKIKTSSSENSSTLHAVVAVKKGDVGFAYGAGLEFALNANHTSRLDLGYRGFYGLVDMDSNTSGTDTYNVIVKASRQTQGAYIGFTFLF